MPYPNNACSGEEIPQPCCTTLWDQGVDLLTVVADELAQCIVTSSCCQGGMRMFMSLGTPQTWQTDILCVYLQGLVYSSGTFQSSGSFARLPLARAQWVVYLMESCYPNVTEDGDTPNDDVLHIVNEHAYAHGEAIYRAVVRSVQPGGVFGACQDFALGSLAPILPIAGSAGWTFNVQMQVAL